jgi:hypothetical protein
LLGGPDDVDEPDDGLVEPELLGELLVGTVGDVGFFLDPLEPHALTAISTASAPAEQARLLAMCTHSR